LQLRLRSKGGEDELLKTTQLYYIIISYNYAAMKETFYNKTAKFLIKK